MTPVDNADRLFGSLEGTLREPAAARPRSAEELTPESKGEKAPERPGDARQDSTEPPMVLYGRLGYIRRELAQLDGAVHHNPPPDA